MQTRLTVIHLHLLGLLIDTIQTTVRDSKHLIRRHRYLRHVVVREMRRPLCRSARNKEQRAKNKDGYVSEFQQFNNLTI